MSIKFKPEKRKKRQEKVWIVQCGHFVSSYFCPVVQCDTMAYFTRSHYLVGWCYFRLVLVSVTRSKCALSSLFCFLQFQLIKVKRQLCARARAACDAVNDDRDILADFETEEM